MLASYSNVLGLSIRYPRWQWRGYCSKLTQNAWSSSSKGIVSGNRMTPQEIFPGGEEGEKSGTRREGDKYLLWTAAVQRQQKQKIKRYCSGEIQIRIQTKISNSFRCGFEERTRRRRLSCCSLNHSAVNQFGCGCLGTENEFQPGFSALLRWSANRRLVDNYAAICNEFERFFSAGPLEVVRFNP